MSNENNLLKKPLIDEEGFSHKKLAPYYSIDLNRHRVHSN